MGIHCRGQSLLKDWRLVELLQATARNDIQLFDAPLFDKATKKRIAGYKIFNPIRLVECLDIAKSKIEFGNDKKTIEGVYTAVFKASKIVPTVNVFRPKEWPYQIVFSEKLVSTLIGKDLRGVAFIKCKSS